MDTLTITATGRIRLRKDLMKHLGVEPGDKIDIEKLPGGRIGMQAVRPTGKISDAFDFLKTAKGETLSIEEIGKIAKRA